MSDAWLCWSKHRDSILRRGGWDSHRRGGGEGAPGGRKAFTPVWTTLDHSSALLCGSCFWVSRLPPDYRRSFSLASPSPPPAASTVVHPLDFLKGDHTWPSVLKTFSWNIECWYQLKRQERSTDRGEGLETFKGERE